jgi:hypothetical protein
MNNRCNLKSVLFNHLPAYRENHTLSPHQSQVCSHIITCHTPALGSRAQMQCDQCDFSQPCYHSCRDRHCPSCQRDASQAWCEQQRKTLLPVTYHHLVFTLPSSLNGWVSLHPELIYRELFRCVWDTLRRFGSDPKRLDGKIGVTAVLHTWGENLSRHVHLHCLVPGGALGADGQWHSANSQYLFPVRALSRRFRGLMVSALRTAADTGKLHRVTRPGEIDSMLDALMKPAWVVFSKPCPARAGNVIDYLGRYTHRIAISDQRIVSIDNERVCFKYKDYAADGEHKVMALGAQEFIRRFLLHVLPKGLMRIRHYGLLANRCRRQSIERVRKAIEHSDEADTEQTDKSSSERQLSNGAYRCPKCRRGYMRLTHSAVDSVQQLMGC